MALYLIGDVQGCDEALARLLTYIDFSPSRDTLYLLDEPSTGLHFDDIRKLLVVVQRLVDLGNTVVMIEHNLDIVKTADWVIDMGPEGGTGGGQVVAVGTPEKVAKVKASHTGRFLKELLR